MRPTLVTAAFVASVLLAGCGKSPTSVSSYSTLTHVANQSTAVTAPVATGYAPTTTATGTPAATTTTTAQTGSFQLGISSLTDTTGAIATIDISLSGPGLAQPLDKKLSAADFASSNTLAYDHIPVGQLTATLQALSATGQVLGTQATTVAIAASNQTQLQLQLAASPFGFTAATPAAADATTGTGETTGTTTAPATLASTGALGVSITSQTVEHQYLIFKRLSVVVHVTNHSTTEALNGEVVLDFHKTSGIFTKTDSVVQTLTSPVTALAPGQSIDVTLVSTVSADTAQATVHTVVASSSSDDASAQDDSTGGLAALLGGS